MLFIFPYGSDDSVTSEQHSGDGVVLATGHLEGMRARVCAWVEDGALRAGISVHVEATVAVAGAPVEDGAVVGVGQEAHLSASRVWFRTARRSGRGRSRRRGGCSRGRSRSGGGGGGGGGRSRCGGGGGRDRSGGGGRGRSGRGGGRGRSGRGGGRGRSGRGGRRSRGRSRSGRGGGGRSGRSRSGRRGSSRRGRGRDRAAGDGGNVATVHRINDALQENEGNAVTGASEVVRFHRPDHGTAQSLLQDERSLSGWMMIGIVSCQRSEVTSRTTLKAYLMGQRNGVVEADPQVALDHVGGLVVLVVNSVPTSQVLLGADLWHCGKEAVSFVEQGLISIRRQRTSL